MLRCVFRGQHRYFVFVVMSHSSAMPLPYPAQTKRVSGENANASTSLPQSCQIAELDWCLEGPKRSTLRRRVLRLKLCVPGKGQFAHHIGAPCKFQWSRIERINEFDRSCVVASATSDAIRDRAR